ILRRIPTFMLLDDHEISDNWEPIASPDDPGNAKLATDGTKAFKKYQRGRNGELETFQFDGFSFFMLDTRTKRMHRKVGPTLSTANLFGMSLTDTMGRLKNWLLAEPGPKFVISPSMMLPRHRRAVQRDSGLSSSNLSALHSDGWDGYPNTL